MSHLPTRPSRRESGIALAEADRPLDTLLKTHDVVQASEDYLVVTPKQLADTNTATGELGTSGGSAFNQWLRDDYNPHLRGFMGIRKYDEMKRSDATVRKSLRLVKTPVLAARWYVQPATDRPRDQMIAQFVWDNLTKHMSVSWMQTIVEALLMLDYGYYMMEKVYAPGPDGRVIIKKLAPRHPIDVIEWDFDNEGGPNGVWMAHPSKPQGRVYIPIEKLMVFTFDREGNNILGVSVLRSAYKHWYMKDVLYKIDAIQKERHGIGIPIIKLPPGFTAKDRRLANELGRNLRTNERAHVTLPPMWELEFIKIEGRPVDAMKSAEHHDNAIMGNVMGEFINGPKAQTGADNQWNVFQKSNAFTADIIRDVFNQWCIPDLVDMNWRVKEYPELRVRRIGDTVDWRTISFALRNMVGAGLLRPDDPLEEWIRDEMDLPMPDPETARMVATPQGPPEDEEEEDEDGNPVHNRSGVAGPPRQGRPSAGPPAANAGTDRSGG